MHRMIILFTIFFIILVTFLVNPAPLSFELADLILIALPCFLGLFSLVTMTIYTIHKTEYDLLIAIMLYLSYLLFSVLLGLLQGIPILNILRSIGPYLNFFPLLLISLHPIRLLGPWSIGAILIMIGMMQAGYQIFLYFTHSNTVENILDVLRGRITLIDPRTTLPIVLSVAILPIVFLSNKESSFLLKLFAVCLMLLGFFAGIVTLTRAIILSIIVGWLAFIILYLYYQTRLNLLSFSHWFRRFCIYITLLIIGILLISKIESIHMLARGLLARFYHGGANVAADYSNGRIYDEWIPALNTWMNSGSLSLFFGIGAGNTFTVATGEERTYIHNLFLYSLVYGGLYGCFTCLWLYFTVFKTLVIRAFQTHQLIYLGFAALLSSIFFYGQLFAVHKGLAFNAMLFLIMTLALSQPVIAPRSA